MKCRERKRGRESYRVNGVDTNLCPECSTLLGQGGDGRTYRLTNPLGFESSICYMELKTLKVFFNTIWTDNLSNNLLDQDLYIPYEAAINIWNNLLFGNLPQTENLANNLFLTLQRSWRCFYLFFLIIFYYFIISLLYHYYSVTSFGRSLIPLLFLSTKSWLKLPRRRPDISLGKYWNILERKIRSTRQHLITLQTFGKTFFREGVQKMNENSHLKKVKSNFYWFFTGKVPFIFLSQTLKGLWTN